MTDEELAATALYEWGYHNQLRYQSVVPLYDSLASGSKVIVSSAELKALRAVAEAARDTDAAVDDFPLSRALSALDALNARKSVGEA